MTARLSLMLVVMPLLAACSPAGSPPANSPAGVGTSVQTMPQGQSEAARVALVEWFECEECEEGQLQAVVKHGERLVPLLKAALLEGAAPASEELLRLDLERRYDELRRNQEAHPGAKVASTKEEFVALYLGNLNA